MEWVSQMGKNVVHKPPNFPELPLRPTPDDLVIVPEGRGVRIRLAEGKMKLWMETKIEATDMKNPKEDKEPAFTLTTREPYSALGTSMLLVGLEFVHFRPG